MVMLTQTLSFVIMYVSEWSKSMKYTHIIWDFNGTIFDDVDIGIKAANKLLSRRGMRLIEDVEQYREYFGFPIKEYYRRVGFDFEKESYEDILAPEWVDEYTALEPYAELCVGALEALELFCRSGVRQSIVSASYSKMLKKQLSRLGIDHYFYDVVGCDDFLAGGKSDICAEFVKKHPRDTFLLIGDTTHDFCVAENSGIDCALVLTGHMPKKKLLECSKNVYEDSYVIAKNLIYEDGSLL